MISYLAPVGSYIAALSQPLFDVFGCMTTPPHPPLIAYRTKAPTGGHELSNTKPAETMRDENAAGTSGRNRRYVRQYNVTYDINALQQNYATHIGLLPATQYAPTTQSTTRLSLA